MTAAPKSPTVTREDRELAEKFKGLWGSFAERLPVEDLAYALATSRLAASTPGANSERMREAINAGLKAFCEYEPDFDMSSAMRRSAADFIMGQSGMFPAAVERGEVAREALAWLASDTRLSLFHYSPMYGDDDDQSEEWRVSRESGPINDREWEVVGRGPAPLDAILSALSRDGRKA